MTAKTRNKSSAAVLRNLVFCSLRLSLSDLNDLSE